MLSEAQIQTHFNVSFKSDFKNAVAFYCEDCRRLVTPIDSACRPLHTLTMLCAGLALWASCDCGAGSCDGRKRRASVSSMPIEYTRFEAAVPSDPVALERWVAAKVAEVGAWHKDKRRRLSAHERSVLAFERYVDHNNPVKLTTLAYCDVCDEASPHPTCGHGVTAMDIFIPNGRRA